MLLLAIEHQLDGRTGFLREIRAQDPEIPRAEFMRNLAKLVNYPEAHGDWHFDDDLFD